MYRYEKKFAIQSVDINPVLHAIQTHPAKFDEIYSGRFINNIYFDTPELSFYWHNCIGDSLNRTKIRVRWYGDLSGSIEKPVLEFKIRQGDVNTKKSFPLSPFTLNQSFRMQDLLENIANAGVPKEYRLMVMACSPTLVNRYYRKYFLSADGRFRSTIDHQQQFFAISPFENSFEFPFSLDNHMVLEIKYKPEDSDHTNLISDGFPYRLSRNSKYVTGVELVVGKGMLKG